MATSTDTPADAKDDVPKELESPQKEQPPPGQHEPASPAQHDKEDVHPAAVNEDDDPAASSPASKPKKRARKSADKTQPELTTPVATASTDRPARERKSVERYSASPSAKTRGSKSLSIAKGSGTQLKDIPNVAFKLSKQKPDENLQLLHAILFGKKVKAHSLKRNIGQFSGFVWSDNEEKQRARVKEKLDKCVKDKLIYFCDILNIPINKTGVKKEELSVKILDFLESPHTTTNVLLADKEQGQKRKRKSTSSKSLSTGEASAEGIEKKQKKRAKTDEKEKMSTEEDAKNDDHVAHSDSGDDSNEDNEKDKVSTEEVAHIESKSEEEEDAKEEADTKGDTSDREKAKEGKVGESGDSSKPRKKATRAKPSKSPSTSAKKLSRLKKNDENVGGTSGSPATVKGYDLEKKTEKDDKKDRGTPSKGKSSSKKQSSKSPVKASVKDREKGRNSKKAKSGPTKEEMHEVVVEILKVVDFNTATLSDILKQLGTRFGVDLYSRKAEVKEIITDVINNMSDDEEEDEEDAKNDDGGMQMSKGALLSSNSVVLT